MRFTRVRVTADMPLSRSVYHDCCLRDILPRAARIFLLALTLSVRTFCWRFRLLRLPGHPA
jgi:hypothetical protein